MKKPAVNDDATSLVTIRNFLAAEKPDTLSPLDIGIMVSLLSRKAEDHAVYDSHQRLAQMFNTDMRTISRAMVRLEDVGYIHQHHRRGKTSLVSVCYENVPADDVLRSKITDDARDLATRYMRKLQEMGRKQYPKPWLAQQYLSAQRILNECEGDMVEARQIVGFALSTPRFKARSKKSLYHVMAILPAIIKARTAHKAAIQAQAETNERKENYGTAELVTEYVAIGPPAYSVVANTFAAA